MRKIISILLIFCVMFAYIPFGNFAKADTQKVASEEKSVETEKASVELTEKRNAFSKTYLNEDGTLTTEISQTPQHFLDETGSWQEIDNTLVKTNQGYENKENSLDIEFNEKMDEESLGLTLAEEEYEVNLQLQSVQNQEVTTVNTAVGTVKENQITYTNVFDDISAIYTVGENFVKEDIVIEQKPESGLPENFTYKVQLNGLNYQVIDNVVWLMNPTTKEAVFKIQAPFMYDAYAPEEFHYSGEVPSIPEEAKSYDIGLEAREENGYLIVTMIPNQEWLNAVERVYPIVIDPTIYRVTGTTLMTDTTLRSAFPTQIGGNDTELGVGRSGDNVVRSLLRFDLSAIDNVSTILSADLSMYLSSTNSASPINISTHKVNNVWNENEATWQNRTTGIKWTTAGAEYNTTAYSTVSNISTIPTDISKGLTKWSIPLESLTEWVYNSSINYGILLKSTSESTKVYKKFYSSESTVDSAYKPKLVITYETSARLGLEDYWDYYEYNMAEGRGFANIGTQNNVIQYTDFSLANYGDFDFNFTRTYNSKTFEKSALGHGVTFTGNEKLYLFTGKEKNTMAYQDADGTVHDFIISGTGFVNPKGFTGIFTKIDATTYTLKEDQVTTTFVVRHANVDTDVQVAYITKQEDAYGHTITYTYDTAHQLTKIQTGLGDTLTFNYRNGVIVDATSKNKKIVYNYNGQHYITSVDTNSYDSKTGTVSFLSKTQFKYVSNQLATIIDRAGNVNTFKYHTGSVTKENVRLGLISLLVTNDKNEDPIETIFTLHNDALQATVTKPGETITYGLDSNYIVKSVTSDGNTTSYEMDDQYNVIKVSEFTGNVLENTIQYNYLNNLLTQKIENGVVLNKYDYSNGLLVKQTDEDGTIMTYDAKERLVSVQSNQNNVVSTTTYTYDTHGNLSSVKEVNGTNTSTITYTTSYDVTNQQITQTSKDALGITTKQIYDYHGNLVAMVDGKGYRTNYTYDINGNLAKAINPNGKTFMQLAYNKDNQVIEEVLGAQSVTNPVIYTFKYGYDEAGTLNSVLKPNGNKIIFSSNESESNVTTVTKTEVLKDGEKTPETYFISTKKENSILYQNIKAEQFVKKITNANNQENIKNPDDFTLSFNDKTYAEYTFNPQSAILEQVKIRDSKGSKDIQYSYDNDLLKSISFTKASGNKLKLAEWTYNHDHAITNVTFGNGNAAITSTYTPNSKRLASETFSANGNKTWKNYSYAYDANQNITNITSSSNNLEYTYDELNQLKKEVIDGKTIEYTYDSLGNRTSKKTAAGTNTYTFNGANQLIKDGQIAFTYDGNGNLTNDKEYTYTWNDFDQLETVKKDGTEIATYQYDENGRRISSKVGTKETYYRYDGSSNHVLFEENKTGEIIKAYTYDENGHPLTMMMGDNVYYYLTNYRGDVLALTNEAGTVVAEYTYDAWGNILSHSGEMEKENPYRYAGYRYDEETKLYYLMARYYNPDTGVFLSLDPESGDTTIPISMNGYNYANNNPVINVDPDGEYAQFIIPVVGLVVRLKAVTKVTTPKKVTSPTKKSSGCNCFTAGTKVLTEDGEKNIEDIEVGDMVLAKSEFDADGELAYKEVTALYTNYRNDLIKLYIGDLLIETTDNHPFWVEGRGWVFADELKAGDKLQKADGSQLIIDKVEFVLLDEPVMVYNFTVADYHTYYVTDLGIWVHNTKMFCGSASDLADLARKSKKNDGLSGMKVSADLIHSAAIIFVGKGAKVQKISGGIRYLSKDGLRAVRTGQKTKKGVYEANFEMYDKKGNKLTNYHVELK